MNKIMKLFVFELVHNFLMKYEICITYKILNLYCICRMPVGTSSISPITHYIIVTDKLNNIRLGSKLGRGMRVTLTHLCYKLPNMRIKCRRYVDILEDLEGIDKRTKTS